MRARARAQWRGERVGSILVRGGAGWWLLLLGVVVVEEEI
jgi:hypothetical protein